MFLEKEELLELKAPEDPVDLMDKLDLLDLSAHKDPKELKESVVTRVNLELQETKDLMDQVD